MFWTAVHCVFWFVTYWQKWFALSRVKIRREWPKGKRKLLRVSGRSELSNVRVVEDKIAVIVWRKSRENRVWFELSGVDCIPHLGANLYWYQDQMAGDFSKLYQILMIKFPNWTVTNVPSELMAPNCNNATTHRNLLRTVPTIVIAHTFCASPDTRIFYRRCLLIQGYFCAV